MRRRKLSRDFARFFLLIRFSLNSPLRFRTVDRVIRQETSLGIFFEDQKKKKKKRKFLSARVITENPSVCFASWIESVLGKARYQSIRK